MMGYNSYISKEYPSRLLSSIANDTFEIGLSYFSCDWNTKYVADNYEESMSTCEYKNTPYWRCYHADDIVITCLVDEGI